MQISEIKRIAEIRKIREKKQTKIQSSFLLDETEEAVPAEITDITPMNLDNLVLLQELNSKQQDITLSLNHANVLLANLEQLKENLLHGKYEMNTLNQLKQEMQSLREKTEDAILEEIINDIELRAEVELAKQQRKNLVIASGARQSRSLS